MSFDNDKRELIKRVEMSLSQADWRSMQNFGTDEQRFAFEMRECMRDVLALIDVAEEEMEDCVSSCQTDISDAEERADHLEEVMSKVCREMRDAISGY